MKNHTQEYFDKISKNYSNIFTTKKNGKSFEFIMRKQIIRNLSKFQNGKLLDCACGSGEITHEIILSSHFQKITVVDFSKNMLEIAKKNLSNFKNISFIHIDIFKFNNDYKKTFDLIICVGLIAHINNLSYFLLHIKKMLNKEGIIILQFTNSNHIFCKIVKFISNKRYYRINKYNLSYYTIDDLISQLEKNNLKIIKEEKYCLGLPFADKLFPFLNFYLEKFFYKFFPNKGIEIILSIAHK